MNNKMTTLFSLRDVIGQYMTELGNTNKNVVIVNADSMGTCRNRAFCEKYPHRAFNVGIAEQNMISFAAGLAREDFIPFVFSMAPFISMRACEQCRSGVAYNNLNVKMIAPYAGYSGGISGATHWALEDCAIMSTIAGMTVLEASDPKQAISMLEAVLNVKGPVYIRNSVELVPNIYDETYQFVIGKASIPRKGNDGTFICSGIVVKYALEAAQAIEKKYGKKIRVVDMHTIKPIDKDAILDAAKTGAIVVAQDHNIIGGLGYHVAAVLAENSLVTKFKMLGGKDKFVAMAHADYLYHEAGFDGEGLITSMMGLIG